MNKNSEELKFSFVPEKPILEDDKNPLLFGHKEIVDSLISIVRSSPEDQSLTVGLFGDWGSGKSTIAENLQKKLKKSCNDPVPVFIFDVWKHEGDALRRTFLKELVDKLHENEFIDPKFTLKKEVYSNVKEVLKSLKINWKILGYLLLVISFIIICLSIPFVFFWLAIEFLNPIIDTDKALDNFFGWLLSVLSVGTIASLLIKLSKEILENKDTYYEWNKYSDPSQFEKEFARILKKGLLKRKLVIVFDNLDRVSGDKAVNIISTIKTFLEPVDVKEKNREVVFIIPCDYKAIKRHLSISLSSTLGLNSDQSDYAEEYLRKFFNTTLRIPDFNSAELENYAWKCLNKTNLDEFKNKRLSSLITLAFKDNPRQIIQFINTLISNFILLKQRELNDRGVYKGFVANNTIQLAKFLLLVQRFPNIMRVFRENHIYDLGFFYDKRFNTLFGETYGEDQLTNERKEFKNFCNMTDTIVIDSLEIFFKFRRTEHERIFPNSSKLIRMIEENQIKILIEEKLKDDYKEEHTYLESLDIRNNIETLSDLVKDKLNEKRKSNPIDVVKFLNGLFYLTKYFDISLTNLAYEFIGSLFNDKSINSNIDQIDPVVLKNEFLEKYDKIRNNTLLVVISSWSGKANSQSRIVNKDNIVSNYLRNVILSCLDYPNIIIKNNSIQDDLKIAIVENFVDDFDLIIKILKNEIQHLFIDEAFLIKYINKINITDFENKSSNRLRIFNIISDSIFTVNCLESALKNINSILSHESGNSFENRLEVHLRISNFIIVFVNRFKNRFDLNNSSIKSQFVNIYNNLLKLRRVDSESLWIFFPIFKLLHDVKVFNDERAIDIQVELINSFSSNSLSRLAKHIENTKDYFDISKIKEVVRYRANKEQLVLESVYEFVSDDLKTEILCDLLKNGRYYNRFWGTVRKFSNDIPNKKKVSDQILNQLNRSNINIDHSVQFYKILDELDLSKEELDYQSYSNMVKELLISNDSKKRDLGIGLINESNYINENIKSKLLIDSLEELFKNLKNNISAVLHIFECVNDFPFDVSDKLYLTNKEMISDYIINSQNDSFYILFSSTLSIEKLRELINSLLLKFTKKQINSTQLSNSYTFLLNRIISDINSHNLYFEVKPNLTLTTEILLNHLNNKSILDLCINFLSIIKSNSRRVVSPLDTKVDTIFENQSPNSVIRKRLNPYVSAELRDD